jgi:hypothetical protein
LPTGRAAGAGTSSFHAWQSNRGAPESEAPPAYPGREEADVSTDDHAEIERLNATIRRLAQEIADGAKPKNQAADLENQLKIQELEESVKGNLGAVRAHRNIMKAHSEYEEHKAVYHKATLKHPPVRGYISDEFGPDLPDFWYHATDPVKWTLVLCLLFVILTVTTFRWHWVISETLASVEWTATHLWSIVLWCMVALGCVAIGIVVRSIYRRGDFSIRGVPSWSAEFNRECIRLPSGRFVAWHPTESGFPTEELSEEGLKQWRLRIQAEALQEMQGIDQLYTTLPMFSSMVTYLRNHCRGADGVNDTVRRQAAKRYIKMYPEQFYYLKVQWTDVWRKEIGENGPVMVRLTGGALEEQMILDASYLAAHVYEADLAYIQNHGHYHRKHKIAHKYQNGEVFDDRTPSWLRMLTGSVFTKSESLPVN